jgi:hypothetical protein
MTDRDGSTPWLAGRRLQLTSRRAALARRADDDGVKVHEPIPRVYQRPLLELIRLAGEAAAGPDRSTATPVAVYRTAL